jgi:hypothetical protein
VYAIDSGGAGAHRAPQAYMFIQLVLGQVALLVKCEAELWWMKYVVVRTEAENKL